MTEPVLVTGGTGVVGGAVLRRLVADGRAVRALARSEGSEDAVAALGAEAVRGDVLDLGSLTEAMRGCSTVFHVAGVNAMCLRDPSDMIRTNVEGSANVVRAAADAGGRTRRLHLVLVDDRRAPAHGRTGGLAAPRLVPVRLRALQAPGRTAGVRAREVARRRGRVGEPLLRPGTGAGDRLGAAPARGRERAAPGPRRHDDLAVDIEDCAKGHVLAETRGTPGERYLLSGASLTTREAVDLLDRIWGLPRRVRFAPGWVATAGGEIAGAVAKVLRRDATLCPEAVRTLLHGHRYDGSRAARELGLRYTPVETTLRRTLEWCEERGLVPPARERRTRT